MVGGGAVAVRRGNCDCSDSHTDDYCGANGDAADERGAHQWGRCDWRCCYRRNCSRLCECLYGDQTQDSSGSENFFHDQSFFYIYRGKSLFVVAHLLYQFRTKLLKNSTSLAAAAEFVCLVRHNIFATMLQKNCNYTVPYSFVIACFFATAGPGAAARRHIGRIGGALRTCSIDSCGAIS